MPDELTAFEYDLATLLIGVDSLWGGDALHESGAHHLLVDTWTSGKEPPAIYADGFSAHLREAEGIKPSHEAAGVNDYVQKYHLYDLPHTIKTKTNNFDPDRRKYLFNLADSLDIMLKTAVACVNEKQEPSFEERRRAATRQGAIEIIDTAALKESLRDALSRVGYEVSPSRNLRETLIAYDEEKRLPPEQITELVPQITAQLLQLTQERIFPQLNDTELTYWKRLSDVPFDGHEFKTIAGQLFTGSSIYRGGEADGRPRLQGLFEYNTDHTLTMTNLHHLCSHEIMPGHYLNSAVMDLLWRSGHLGFEATTAQMCSPSAIFQEGWAQVTYELLYGSREQAIQELGADLRVFFAFEDLQDIGKNNVGILHLRDKCSVSEVKQYVADQCVQPDPIVKKLSGAWAHHLIVAPMYGPAYHLGKTIIQQAIKVAGREKVARVGLHVEGLVDIETFKTKVYRG